MNYSSDGSFYIRVCIGVRVPLPKVYARQVSDVPKLLLRNLFSARRVDVVMVHHHWCLTRESRVPLSGNCEERDNQLSFELIDRGLLENCKYSYKTRKIYVSSCKRQNLRFFEIIIFGLYFNRELSGEKNVPIGSVPLRMRLKLFPTTNFLRNLIVSVYTVKAGSKRRRAYKWTCNVGDYIVWTGKTAALNLIVYVLYSWWTEVDQ